MDSGAAVIVIASLPLNVDSGAAVIVMASLPLNVDSEAAAIAAVELSHSEGKGFTGNSPSFRGKGVYREFPVLLDQYFGQFHTKQFYTI